MSYPTFWNLKRNADVAHEAGTDKNRVYRIYIVGATNTAFFSFLLRMGSTVYTKNNSFAIHGATAGRTQTFGQQCPKRNKITSNSHHHQHQGNDDHYLSMCVIHDIKHCLFCEHPTQQYLSVRVVCGSGSVCFFIFL